MIDDAIRPRSAWRDRIDHACYRMGRKIAGTRFLPEMPAWKIDPDMAQRHANGWLLNFMKGWVVFGPIGLHIALMVAIVMLPIVFVLFLVGRMFLDAGHVANIVVDATTPSRFRRF